MARPKKNADRGFTVHPVTYPSGTEVFEVRGYLDGKRVREYLDTLAHAEARRLELEYARMGRKVPELPRMTWLSSEQLRVAEGVFSRHPEPEDVRRAVDWWEKHGQAQAAAAAGSGNIGLDEAARQFSAWLNSTKLRELSKRNLRTRVGVFASELGDIPLATITPESIEGWLKKRKVSPVSRDNDRRAVARFLGWCGERPRGWLANNPARGTAEDLPEKGAPQILTLRQCMRMLAAARRVRGGILLKWTVLGLFGGMRPFEAARFQDADVIGGQLRIEAKNSKVKRTRVLDVPPVLAAWLQVAGRGPVANPTNHRRAWEEILRRAKIGAWVPDILRHSSLSHLFRRLGSYGLVAEHGGTSEGMVKGHYQARTTPGDSAEFWAMFPTRAERQAARGVAANVLQLPAVAA